MGTVGRGGTASSSMAPPLANASSCCGRGEVPRQTLECSLVRQIGRGERESIRQSGRHRGVSRPVHGLAARTTQCMRSGYRGEEGERGSPQDMRWAPPERS